MILSVNHAGYVYHHVTYEERVSDNLVSATKSTPAMAAELMRRRCVNLTEHGRLPARAPRCAVKEL